MHGTSALSHCTTACANDDVALSWPRIRCCSCPSAREHVPATVRHTTSPLFNTLFKQRTQQLPRAHDFGFFTAPHSLDKSPRLTSLYLRKPLPRLSILATARQFVARLQLQAPTRQPLSFSITSPTTSHSHNAASKLRPVASTTSSRASACLDSSSTEIAAAPDILPTTTPRSCHLQQPLPTRSCPRRWGQHLWCIWKFHERPSRPIRCSARSKRL